MKIKHVGIALFLGLVSSHGADPAAESTPRFMGASSCSSTGCHGGATEKNNQNLIWSKLDYHSRSYATLTSARSERFAETLKLGDATKSQRCTVCHAPFHSVDEKLRLADAIPIRGVSCESCHAPAEHWLRSHTRPDFSHDDRVAAGMRDLKNLYVRANTCVACHQTLDHDLAKAGHPELIFELDGQSVSEPKHWTDKNPHTGAQAWLIGQAVALREVSWQMSRDEAPDENLLARWHGLVWLLQKVCDANSSWPDLKSLPPTSSKELFVKAKGLSDDLARRAAEMNWTEETTRKCLAKLAATAADFEDSKQPVKIQARRAERLALALDRLTHGLSDSESKLLEAPIKSIFQQVQSLPGFDSPKFANAIRQFVALAPAK